MSPVDDVRYAIRIAVRQRGRAVLAVAILALGIGAATAVFSVVDQTVLRRPPFTAGDRLVDVLNIRRGGGGGSGHSAEKVLAWRNQPSVFERLETLVPRTLDLSGGAEPERITTLAVSPGLFDMLGVQPVLGRPFVADDAAPGAESSIIVSRRLAERRLGGAQGALGRRLTAGHETFVVVGVMPDSFTLLGRDQAWLPMDPRQHLGRARAGDFFVLARLVEGLTVAEAQNRANRIADRLQAEMPTPRTWDIRIDEKRVAGTSPAIRSALLALLGGVCCLWLLACFSAMQVVLAIVTEQQHELEVRASLGATRALLVRQVLVHVGLLAAAGGALGALAAHWAVRLFAVSAPSFLTFWRTAPMAVDERVLTAAATASVAAAVVAGLVPALWLTRPGTVDARGATRSPRGADHLSSVVVATQVACAVVLAVGAGLMFRTITNVGRIPLGLDPDGVVLMSVNAPVGRYPTAATQFAFAARVLDRLRGAPGVASAAVAGGLTFSLFGGERLASAEVVGLPDDTLLAMNSVSDGYFETLRVPVRSGRTFTRADMGTNVVVLGHTLATRLWPRGNPVGATMKSLDDGRTWTVIGVVADLDDRISHDRPVHLQWYVPRSTAPAAVPSAQGTTAQKLIVRAASLELGLAAVKSAVWAEDPDQPIERVTPARDELREVFAAHVLVQRLAGGLSAIGLAVAGVGVFGVLAQMVAGRRREIGVRMALGATPARVARLVLVRAFATLAVGVVFGLAAAVALTRGLKSVLFGVSPLDPASMTAAALVVTALGLAAAWWPARSAARVDPAVVMREE